MLNLNSNNLNSMKKIVSKINNLESVYSSMDDASLKNVTNVLKARLLNQESLDDILPDAFAAVREASKRTLGLIHYDVQLLGGIVLHNGNIAEMKTGEGKTLVAVCPAYLNALSGHSVHIITVNEYLAQRDKENMGKIFSFLGMSTGVLLSSQDSSEKQKQYSCDVIYGTNSEFGFDYLRNNMATSLADKFQGDLYFAIIDEADSILIDEARTPLIITQAKEKPVSLYTTADAFAKSLDLSIDLNINEKDKVAMLTDNGINKAEKFFGIKDYMSIENLEFAHHVTQALQANYIMRNNIDYLVQDSKVLIVDSFTGRIMSGKRYNQGLHQAIEAKERVEILNESKVCATITYQNFFRMYNKISGMTGTAKTEEEEFKSIYKMKVFQIPTNKPVIRIDASDSVFKTKAAKINALVKEIQLKYKICQPVLVGTASIESSEIVSEALKEAGIPHQILNAKHHEQEASIIAQAGRFKAITIATNMAGRGTDILLGGNPEFLAKQRLKNIGYSDEELKVLDVLFVASESDYSTDFIATIKKNYSMFLQEETLACEEESKKVLSVGGLCILGTERHESRRIDDQLRGRSGRQGDCGESKFFISLEDDLIRIFGGDKIYSIIDKLGMSDDLPLDSSMLSKSIKNAQKRVESSHFALRKYLIDYDNVMNVQREIIYVERNAILVSKNINELFYRIVYSFIDDILTDYILGSKPSSLEISALVAEFNLIISSSTLTEELVASCKTKKELRNTLFSIIRDIYENKEIIMKDNDFNREVKAILLGVVDVYWSNHIDDMNELKQGIGLRAIGQQEPKQAYSSEGSVMFSNMNKWIRKEILNRVCLLTVEQES